LTQLRNLLDLISLATNNMISQEELELMSTPHNQFNGDLKIVQSIWNQCVDGGITDRGNAIFDAIGDILKFENVVAAAKYLGFVFDAELFEPSECPKPPIDTEESSDYLNEVRIWTMNLEKELEEWKKDQKEEEHLGAIWFLENEQAGKYIILKDRTVLVHL
jgi:hypothetical protein